MGALMARTPTSGRGVDQAINTLKQPTAGESNHQWMADSPPKAPLLNQEPRSDHGSPVKAVPAIAGPSRQTRSPGAARQAIAVLSSVRFSVALPPSS